MSDVINAVPEGWRWVPDGPTTEMRLAGNRAINEAGALLCGISLRQVYAAMLAAAPAQPAAQDQGEVQRLREALVLCMDDAVTTLQNARHFEDAPNALVRIAKTANAALAASTGREA